MKRRIIALTAALALVPMGLTATAAAQTQPGGPWPNENGSSIAAMHSYEELWATLERVRDRAQGAFELDAAPLESNTGRRIPVVTVGDGPTSVMFIATQHGNEYVVGEGMLDLIGRISSNSRAANDIRDALTVTIVPRVNVDGFDADVTDASGQSPPWRQNYDPSCTETPCDPFYATGRGYDVNRYHSYTDNAYDHPYLEGDDDLNPVPEAIATRLLWEERQPELIVDFHHQGTYADDDGRMITGSTMWPNAVATAAELGIEDEFAATIEASKRAVSVLVEELDQYGYANITRYPGTTTPGIARNAYGLLGSASVLFEMRGGIDAKSNGYIAKTAERAGMSLLEAATDGTLWTISTDAADELPDRGPYVRNPRE